MVVGIEVRENRPRKSKTGGRHVLFRRLTTFGMSNARQWHMEYRLNFSQRVSDEFNSSRGHILLSKNVKLASRLFPSPPSTGTSHKDLSKAVKCINVSDKYN